MPAAKVLAAALLVMSSPGDAAPLALHCDAVRFVYPGGDGADLSVAAPYGAFRLPATREGAGPGSFTIRASGVAEVLMPDKAGMDACVAGNARPGDLDSADAFAFLVGTCRGQVREGTGPVATTVEVEIAATASGAVATVTRTYVAITAAIADHIPIVTRSSCVAEAG